MAAVSKTATAEVPKAKPSPMKRVFKFLISMKLAVTLLFVIAILSVLGTILPQGQDVYQTDWPNSPLFDFYKNLGIFDMYYSWWFLTILGLLIANVTTCIINRLPTTVKHAFRLRLDVKDAFIVNQPMSATIPAAGEKGLEAARGLLKDKRYHIHTGQSGSLLAQKGRYSGIASLMFHLSFIIIVLGFVIGGIFGFVQRIEVPDGKTVQVPGTNYQVKSYGFQLQYGEVKDENRVTGYRPTLYSTDVQVMEDGQQLERQTITVNGPLRMKTFPIDPLKLEGVNFFQSSYYQSPSGHGYVSVIEVSSKPGKTLIYFGSALAMIGITLGLYFPHRRVWLKLGKSGELLMGGRANRSKLGFRRDFERITREIQMKLGQEATARE